MKGERKTKAHSILDMEKEKGRGSRGVTLGGGKQMEKRDAMRTIVRSHFIAQGVIPAFMVIIAILAILDIRVVFEPPLLLFILNTLFISIVSFVVAYISARNYLKRGSLSFLLLGCGVLAFGSGNLVAGWLIGPPGGANIAVAIHNVGALSGSVFHVASAALAAAASGKVSAHRKSKLILAYLGVLVFIGLVAMVSLRGAIPPFFIQELGPTLLRQVVLGSAVALFAIASLLVMRLCSKSKEAFQYWYSLALGLIALGLSAVFLQKAVGSPIGWVGRSAQYVGGIYLVIAVSITYMEGRLRIGEEKLRSAFASSPDGITVIDLHGSILECNQSAMDIYGCSLKDEVLGKSVFEFIAKKDHERAMESLKKTLEQGSVKDIEYTLLTRDGWEFPAELFMSVIKDSYGKPTAFVARARDITVRKRAEEVLRRSQEETAHSNRLQEVLRRSLEEAGHSNRLLLALSQAAQAVQRARTPEEVYRTVGHELAQLGYNATIFTLTDDRAHLAVSYLTFEPTLLRVAEKLTGLSAQGYRFPLVPDGFFQAIIAEGETTFSEPTIELIAEALPGPVRPLAGQVAALLRLEQGILAPLTVSGQTHGLLAVSGASLSEVDVSAVTAFANQAAIAIESARLFSSLNEQREQLRALAAQATKVREAERQRLARELHDQVGQNLTALGINLSIAQAEMAEEAVGPVRSRLSGSQALLEQTAESIRNVIADLRPPMLDEYGFVAALRWYAEEFGSRAGLAITVQSEEPVPRLAAPVEIALFRIAQEALMNVAKHARATRAEITVEVEDSTVRLVIADDGIGFNPAHAFWLDADRGWGLLIMTERAEAVDGCCRIESHPGRGTRVVVEVTQ